MNLKSEQDRWEEETLKPVTDRFPERKSEFRTLSGIPLPRITLPLQTRMNSIPKNSVSQVNIPSPEACRPPCTAGVCGP